MPSMPEDIVGRIDELVRKAEEHDLDFGEELELEILMHEVNEEVEV